MNTVSFQYAISVGFPPDQATYDGSLLLFFIEFPLFLHELLVNEYPYLIVDVLIAITSMILVVISYVLVAKGTEYGTGGVV